MCAIRSSPSDGAGAVRVDFYQLSRNPVEAALPLIARATLAAGERLVVVSSDAAQLDRIGTGLWTRLPETFLAHGKAGGTHDARQPILLAEVPEPANGARYLALADGVWRDAADTFERVFLLFDASSIEGARGCWRMLGTRENVERHFWKQESGKWVEGP
jgi:DNA polymerase III subunit chi